jgi:hypothetical protein
MVALDHFERITTSPSPLCDAELLPDKWFLPLADTIVMFGIASHRSRCGVATNGANASEYAPGELYHQLTPLIHTLLR